MIPATNDVAGNDSLGVKDMDGDDDDDGADGDGVLVVVVTSGKLRTCYNYNRIIIEKITSPLSLCFSGCLFTVHLHMYTKAHVVYILTVASLRLLSPGAVRTTTTTQPHRFYDANTF